jgi:hypothetical protein
VRSCDLLLNPGRCKSFLVACWWIRGLWICLNHFAFRCDSRFSNPVPRANSYVILAELEEMCVGSVKEHRPSSGEEF